MKRVALAVLVILAVGAPAAHAAQRATVTGKLTGAKLPAKGKGRVPVWALRLSDGVVVGGVNASPAGRFTLKLPAASYAILAAVVRVGSRADALVRVADFVTAKAGVRRVIKPTLKKRKKPKRHRARGARARAAWVSVDYPMIWVHKWSLQGNDPELKVMEKGLQAMVIADLAAKVGTPSCPGGISAGDDLDKVLGEIKLQQSPYFDQSTRLTTAKLIRPNASVTGTMSRANGQLTLTATYKDNHGGGGTVSVTGPEDGIFDLEGQLVTKLAALICIKTPKTYSASFSGTWTTDLNAYKVTWTGNAVIELTAEHGAPPADGPPPPDYAHYAVTSGRVHAILDGTRGTCTVHGEADFDLATGPLTESNYVQATPDRPWFSLTIATRGDEQIPYTETGLGCNQVNPQYPLTGVPWVSTPKPLQATDRLNLTANTSGDMFTISHFSWAFTFTATS
jgi:hypothetical protein